MADFFKIADFVTITKKPMINPVQHNPNYDMSNTYKAYDQLILYSWAKQVLKFSEKVSLDMVTVDVLFKESRLKFEVAYGILHDEILPMLGLDFKE